MALAAAMSISMAVAVNAENNPKVYIDDTQVSFNDQQPVILGEGTTLVPARGVFEAMGARVQWDGETRTVRIDSADNFVKVYLNIDNPVMEVYTSTSIFSADEERITLDVAPQIINDRTMIPLRAISEAIGADVKWDGDAYSVIIKTKDYEPYTPPTDSETPADKNIKTVMSITSSADSVSEGDTVDIYVNIANPQAGATLIGVTSLVSYSKADFEFEGGTLYGNGQDIGASVSAENPDYHEDAAKVLYVNVNGLLPTTGAVAKLTFKALTSNGGEFALVNSYDTSRGYDNMFTYRTDDESLRIYDVSGDDLFVDATPVTVSGN